MRGERSRWAGRTGWGWVYGYGFVLVVGMRWVFIFCLLFCFERCDVLREQVFEVVLVEFLFVGGA